jgi:hypothetical protein
MSYTSEVARAEGLRQSAYSAGSVEADRHTADIAFYRRLVAAAYRNSVSPTFAIDQLLALNADPAGRKFLTADERAGAAVTTASTDNDTLAAVSAVVGDSTALGLVNATGALITAAATAVAAGDAALATKKITAARIAAAAAAANGTVSGDVDAAAAAAVVVTDLATAAGYCEPY